MTGVQKAIKIGAVCLAVFIIICIFNAILFTIGAITGFNFETTSFSEKYEDIKSLDIEVSSLNIIIEKGDAFGVDATDVSKHLKVEKKANVLKIRENGIGIFRGGKVGSIVITVPEGMLDRLKIDAGAGTIDISKIISNTLDLNQGAGAMVISSSEFRNANIDGGAGEIRVEETILSNLDLDCGVGRVLINGEILGNSDIDCGVGKLSLDLGNQNDYTIIASKGLGSINIAGSDYKDDTTFGNGINKIKVDGGEIGRASCRERV